METIRLRLQLLTSLAFLVLVCGQTPLRCQAPASATSHGTPAEPLTRVQILNAESTGKADDARVPEAYPGRPTISNPARLPPVGYLQFEQGGLEAGSSPSGVERQFSVGQTAKLAVHSRLMLQFASQPIAVTRSEDAPGGPSSSETDTGDLLLGAQIVLVKQKSYRPAVAVGYWQRVRSGTAPDIDVGSSSRSGIVLISGDLGEFHYDTNFSVSEQSEDPVRRAQYGRTLSVSHPLFSDKLGLSGEVWNFTQPLVDTTRRGLASHRSEAVGTLWALAYTLRPNLVLDGGFDRGLTSTSTAWQGFAGFTYLLPHRLW